MRDKLARNNCLSSPSLSKSWQKHKIQITVKMMIIYNTIYNTRLITKTNTLSKERTYVTWMSESTQKKLNLLRLQWKHHRFPYWERKQFHELTNVQAIMIFFKETVVNLQSLILLFHTYSISWTSVWVSTLGWWSWL